MADPSDPLGYAPDEWHELQRRVGNKDYLMPETAKSSRDYAKALMSGEGQFKEVHHPLQGISNMVNALVGGNLDYTTNQRERLRDLYQGNVRNDIAGQAGAFGPSQEAAPPSPSPYDKRSDNSLAPSPMQSAGAVQGTMASGDTSNQLDQMALNKRATASIESAGSKNPYSLLGPTITNPRSAYFGDHAIGKYQVMGKNLGPWGKEVFGHPVTEAEFINDPKMQERMYEAKFQSPTQWFGKGRSDGYTTGDDYRRRFYAAGGKDVAPQGAMAFSGQPPPPPAVQAIDNAAGGMPQNGPPPFPAPLPSGPTPTQVAGDNTAVAARSAPQLQPNNTLNPMPGGPQLVDPRTIPQSHLNPRSLQQLYASGSPADTPEFKNQIFNMALQQGQPFEKKVPGGTVTINRWTGAQQYQPEMHEGEMDAGDGVKIKYQWYYGADGKVHEVPSGSMSPIPGLGGGPRSDAGSPSTPASAPGEPTTAPGGGIAGTQAAQAGPAAPPQAAEGAPASPEKGVQVASLNPAAAAIAAGMNKAASDEGRPAPIPAAEEKPAPKTPAQISTEQFGKSTILPPGVEPGSAAAKAFGIRDYLKKQKVEQTGKEESAKEAANLAAKKYDDVIKNSEIAKMALNNVHVMQGVIPDEGMHWGFGRDFRDNMVKAGDAWHNWMNPKDVQGANAPNEVFDKNASELVLRDLKPMLQGTGQVRVAEIQLLTMANANRDMTPKANQAILAMNEKALNYAVKVGEMATAYRKAHGGLDEGFDAQMKEYADKHPLFSDEEFKDYTKIIANAKEGKGEGEKPKAGPAPGSKLRWNKEKGVME
jgi:hypothetical protein